MDRLFCYGTLEFRVVMRLVAGRDFPRSQAVLRGYARHPVCGEVYPGIVADAGAEVRGTLYGEIGPDVLRLLDDYESALYRRSVLEVETEGGARVAAWVYVVEGQDRLERGDWDPERFARLHMAGYLQALRQAPAGVPVRAPRLSL